MSAPTPAPGDDRPRDGYYPDPSIPGYVRYWNGASWVPGTSRPAPTDGETLAPPPGAQPAQAGQAPLVEETGPHFFDEEPAPGGAQHGSRPEPASAWGADSSRQSGFGGEQDRRVSWGSPQDNDPRDPRAAAPTGHPDGHAARTDGTASIPPAEPDTDAGGLASGDTFMIRRPVAGARGAQSSGASGQGAPGIPSPGGPAPVDGTMAIRALNPRTGQQGGAAGAQAGGTGASAVPGAAHADAERPSAAGAPQGPGFGAGKAAADRAAVAPPQAQAAPGAGGAAQAAGGTPAGLSGPQQGAPSVPRQSGGPQQAAGDAMPMSQGVGGGQSSWAQQVHRLAGPDEDQPVAPWKPPVMDPFQAAAMRQAAARPANLGKRLLARLLDTIALAAVTAVVAVPLGSKALDHVNDKIDAAKLSGETVTVWLLDGTTSVYLGVILAVLLLFGVVYEALPTAKWGRTLGKKLLGLEVRDIEGHQPPEFGAALRRWLVYSVPGLLVIGVVGVLWCVFDRPWRQCWHDKVAHTFVAD
ncbi:RDD family protein [Streptomyces sp. uw30]|uniref:RDD family protein n=1 Tax=Streptomyces sp. uw30 TaxID=1828179 RepID=UPI0011CE3574|nr:RDD family protein [Streptomyces sp. uw30]TXS40648.1 RDD family protein [Streptomyces sp. uw30]